MSKHEPVKTGWSKWLEADGILAFLNGGFRQYRRDESGRAGSGFEATMAPLGSGLVRTFHMI